MGPVITPELYVTKTGEQRWKVRFRHDGRASSRTFTDPAGADMFADLLDRLGVDSALEVLNARVAARVDRTEVTTVENWCLSHIDALSGVEQATRDRYRSYVTRDLGPLGPLPLDALTPEAVARWVNGMEEAGASGKTIANKHGFLAGAMKRAVARKLIPANPCEETRLPRTERKQITFLTHEEYAAFIEFFSPHWQPLVQALFATGLRWSEATALKVGDVDLHAATIHVGRAWKERKGGPPVIGATKSKKSNRTISLAPETVDVLRPLVEDRPGGGWLFTNTRGGPVRDASFHETAWQPAVRLANGEPDNPVRRRRRNVAGEFIEPAAVPLGKRPRIHDARHTCASWLLGAGVPITYVQAHLGHESITTTVNTYGHILPGARKAVSAALSSALTPAAPEGDEEEREELGA